MILSSRPDVEILVIEDLEVDPPTLEVYSTVGERSQRLVQMLTHHKPEVIREWASMMMKVLEASGIQAQNVQIT